MVKVSTPQNVYVDATAINVVNNKIYFYDYTHYGFYVCDLKERKMKTITEENREYEWSKYYYYGSAVIDSRYIVYPPFWKGKCITVFDIYNNSFKYYEMEKEGYYRTAVVINGKMFFIPYKFNDFEEILQFDVCNAVWKKTSFRTKLESGENIYCYSNNVCFDSTGIYLPSGSEGIIYHIDLEGGDVIKIKIPDVSFQIATINKCDNYIWVSGNANQVVRWDFGNEITIIDIDDSDKNYTCDWRFSCAKEMNGYLYFAPVNYDYFIRIDIRSCKRENIISVNKQDVVWELVNISEDKLYASTMSTDDCNAQNFIIGAAGEITIDNEMFSIDDTYTKYDLYERKRNGLKLFLKNICE